MSAPRSVATVSSSKATRSSINSAPALRSAVNRSSSKSTEGNTSRTASNNGTTTPLDDIEQRRRDIVARLQALREERGEGASPQVEVAVLSRKPPLSAPKYVPFYEASQRLTIEGEGRSATLELGQRVQVLTTAATVLDEAEKQQLVFLAHLRKQNISSTTEFEFPEDAIRGPPSPAEAMGRSTPAQQQQYLERHLKKDMMKRVYLGERGLIIGIVTNVKVERVGQGDEDDPEEAFSATRLLAKYGQGAPSVSESGDFVMLRFADGVERAFPVMALDEVHQLFQVPKSRPLATKAPEPAPLTAAPISEIDRRLAKLQRATATSSSSALGSQLAKTADNDASDDIDVLIRSHNAGSTLLRPVNSVGVGRLGQGALSSRPVRPLGAVADEALSVVAPKNGGNGRGLSSPDASPPPKTKFEGSENVGPTAAKCGIDTPTISMSQVRAATISIETTTAADSASRANSSNAIHMSPEVDDLCKATTLLASPPACGVDYVRLARFDGKRTLGLLASPPPSYVREGQLC